MIIENTTMIFPKEPPRPIGKQKRRGGTSKQFVVFA